MSRVIVTSKADDVPKAPIDEKPTLVYWNIVGLVMPARLALAYAGVDFVDVRIEAGDAKSDDCGKAWKSAKPSLYEVMTFPNLPYFLDDKVQISQSNAILRYLGRKYDIMGVQGQEHVVDVVLDELTDFEMLLIRFFYSKGKDAAVAWFKEDVEKFLEPWKKLLGDKSYLTGEAVSVADFKLYSVLNKLKIFQLDCMSPEMDDFFPSLLDDYLKRIESLPKVHDYIKGPNHQRRPINNTIAKVVLG